MIDREKALRGALWGGLFAIVALSVVGGVFGWEARRWQARAEKVSGAPTQLASILSDRGFQDGYRRWVERKGRSVEGVTEVQVRQWVLEAARKTRAFDETKLTLKKDAQSRAAEGLTEIQASFQLSGVDTKALQAMILELEEGHPGLVCRDLKIRPAAAPYQYEVPTIVFSIFVSAG